MSQNISNTQKRFQKCRIVTGLCSNKLIKLKLYILLSYYYLLRRTCSGQKLFVLPFMQIAGVFFTNNCCQFSNTEKWNSWQHYCSPNTLYSFLSVMNKWCMVERLCVCARERFTNFVKRTDLLRGFTQLWDAQTFSSGLFILPGHFLCDNCLSAVFDVAITTT